MNILHMYVAVTYYPVCSVPYPGVALGLSDFTLFSVSHGIQKYSFPYEHKQ